MCGIVGAVGFISPKEYIFKGLKMLDYRGYDSAGNYVADDTRIADALEDLVVLNELAQQ